MPSIHLPNFRLSTAPLAAAVLLLCAAGAFAPQRAFAQAAKPIDPGTSVSTRPLDAAAPGSPADDSLKADFAQRQKVLDRRTEENNYRYGVQEHDCYSKFFVNHCLDNARNAMRETRQQIRQEQLALDDERRADRAKQRDQQTAIKRAQYEAEAPQRAANEKASQQAYEDKQRQNALAAAQREADAPQRAANQAAYDRKQADYQKQLDDARARGVQDAQEREQKAQRYEQKQQEAAQHRAEVEARQKEAARKAQEKAQQQEQERQEQLKVQQQQQQQGK
ncbi:lipoprotein [Caballeronia temeraria]|uniref:Lipoprotein n=1 Tax=Caballeronia temeraria TaxID=1777137 RepID=A0A158CWP5_9BURK|nr:lipoprotein [Caballeronia temeraria]